MPEEYDSYASDIDDIAETMDAIVEQFVATEKIEAAATAQTPSVMKMSRPGFSSPESCTLTSPLLARILAGFHREEHCARPQER